MKLMPVLRNACFLMLIGLGALYAQDLKTLARPQQLQRIEKKPPLKSPLAWTVGRMAGFRSENRAKGVRADDGIIVQGANPETDIYTVYVETDLAEVHALRIEALTLPSLGGGGPGRTPHGNFVLSEVTATVAPKAGGNPTAVKFARAEADFEQPGFPAAHAIDGNRATGWAIQGQSNWNVNRTLTLTFASPIRLTGASRWTITVDQQFGSFHTLGRFRILFGSPPSAIPPPPMGTGNWDFESGLQGWAIGPASGQSTSFRNQPLGGDNIGAQSLRDGEMGFTAAIQDKIGGDYWHTPVYSGYQGARWVSSTEFGPTGTPVNTERGTLTSPEFVINKPYLSCLVAGANESGLRVELQVKCSDQTDLGRLTAQVIGERALKHAQYRPELGGPPPHAPFVYGSDGLYVGVSRVSGQASNVMVRTRLDVPAAIQGRTARYKVVDESPAGHISIDDFRASDSEPGWTAPVWGFVDTHTHPMVHMAFGGGFEGPSPNSNSLIWGSPGGKLEASLVTLPDMPDCDGFTHGNMKGWVTNMLDWAARNIFGVNLHHGKGGWQSGFASWPAFDDILHQQMHVQWLRRSFDGGQRILVAAAINNQLLQRVAKNGFDFTGNKFTTPDAGLDFHSCMQQIVAMKDFVAKNSGWMEIVTSPAQARNAIRNNKLAVVLAVETDWLNGMDQVRALYNLGVRHITPVHLMDNIFGSSAFYKDFFNSLNVWFNGQVFDVDNGAPLGIQFLPNRQVPVLNFAGNVLTFPGLSSGGDMFAHGYTVNDSFNPLNPSNPFSPLKHSGYINRHGLKNYTKVIGGGPQPDPIAAYKEMMRLGMLIDVAHMSHRSVEEILKLVEDQGAGSENDYPVSSSHGGIREMCWKSGESHSMEEFPNERSLTTEQCRRILGLGGTLGLGTGSADMRSAPATAVPNDCAGSTKSLAQLFQASNALSGYRGLTLGTDFNGLNGMTGPRFGPKAAKHLESDLPVVREGFSGPMKQLRQRQLQAQGNGVNYGTPSVPAVSVRANQPPMRPSTITSARGTRTFDYNTEGLAHNGLLPDMFQDARNIGLSPKQIGAFFRGAEDFIRMWEKCERLKGAIR